MQITSVLVFALAAMQQVYAANVAFQDRPVLFENIKDIPSGWKQIGKPSPKDPLHFKVILNQPESDLAERTLLEISTPGHAEYGHHMKRDELKELLQPRVEHTAAIHDWLRRSGIDSESIKDDENSISFKTTTAQAETMLSTTFDKYKSPYGQESVRTLRYSIPSQLQEAISFIHPTTRFGLLRREGIVAQTDFKKRSKVQRRQSSGDDPGFNDPNLFNCSIEIRPQCLRNLYNITYMPPKNTPTKFGVANFLDQWVQYDDLEMFLELFEPDKRGANFTWSSINGGGLYQNGTDEIGEAALDMQYALSLAYPIPMHDYSVGGQGPEIPDASYPAGTPNEDWLDFAEYLVRLPDADLPQTITISYAEDEQTLPKPYTAHVCRLFAQLGARGVSILAGSGDYGVGANCIRNDGSNATRFMPNWPTACPWVTSVGGADSSRTSDGHALSQFSAERPGGGFSERFPRPAYQDAAVKAYLHILGDRQRGLYNRAGRAFPDVSAQMYDYVTIGDGATNSAGGTSASTPVFAAVVALLNAARVDNGLPPLGFLNPWIYATACQGGFTDITVGGTVGCTGEPVVPFAGWNTTKGWDPASGWGTPRFEELLKLALKSR